LEELDFRAEAINVDRVAQNFLDRPEICFPRVVAELSTARVLTTHFEEGIKVGDLSRLDAAGVDRQALARLVVETYCQQIFTDGVYHADPHPGNVLVRRGERGDDLTLVFLDFGAVAEIPPEMRRGIIDLLQAAFARDTERIIRSMKQ